MSPDRGLPLRGREQTVIVVVVLFYLVSVLVRIRAHGEALARPAGKTALISITVLTTTSKWVVSKSWLWSLICQEWIIQHWLLLLLVLSIILPAKIETESVTRLLLLCSVKATILNRELAIIGLSSLLIRSAADFERIIP